MISFSFLGKLNKIFIVVGLAVVFFVDTPLLDPIRWSVSSQENLSKNFLVP
jgi:hypothetical protein